LYKPRGNDGIQYRAIDAPGIFTRIALNIGLNDRPVPAPCSA
jgi:hypothetical protein